jgi:uncharacterized protein with NRDE domain
LILATRQWPEVPLLVAANRDEALDRPAGPPRAIVVGDRTALAPIDLHAGGTWLGLNDRGLFVGITNRFGLPKDPARRSRGKLVTEALAFESAEAAYRSLSRLAARQENGFHLVLADRDGAYLIYNDGAAIHRSPLDPGLYIVTERSFDAGPTRRPQAIESRLRAHLAKPLPNWQLEALLSEHDAEGFEGVCVHVPDLGYGTRSSTVIRLENGAKPSFRFANGSPCKHAYEDYEVPTAPTS